MAYLRLISTDNHRLIVVIVTGWDLELPSSALLSVMVSAAAWRDKNTRIGLTKINNQYQKRKGLPYTQLSYMR